MPAIRTLISAVWDCPAQGGRHPTPFTTPSSRTWGGGSALNRAAVSFIAEHPRHHRTGRPGGAGLGIPVFSTRPLQRTLCWLPPGSTLATAGRGLNPAEQVAQAGALKLERFDRPSWPPRFEALAGDHQDRSNWTPEARMRPAGRSLPGTLDWQGPMVFANLRRWPARVPGRTWSEES